MDRKPKSTDTVPNRGKRDDIVMQDCIECRAPPPPPPTVVAKAAAKKGITTPRTGSKKGKAKGNAKGNAKGSEKGAKRKGDA